MLRNPVEEGIDRNYVEIVKETNTGCSTSITLFTNLIHIPIEKGVKRCNPLSTEPFFDPSRRMSWEDRISINRDDSIINASRIASFSPRTMFVKTRQCKEVSARSKELGLKINASKAKAVQFPDCLE